MLCLSGFELDSRWVPMKIWKTVTLSEEHLNPKNLVVVTSEENRMVVKCTLIDQNQSHISFGEIKAAVSRID